MDSSMSVSNAILKQLSDLSSTADEIVFEDVANLNRIHEWSDIVKNAAQSIVEGNERSSFSEGEIDSAKIPTLNFFLSGKGQGRGPRVSTVLKKMAKEKLHQKKGRPSISRKLAVKVALNNETILIQSQEKDTHTPNKESPPDLPQAASSSSSKQIVPKKGTHTTHIQKEIRSSKRKSSSELSPNIAKKTKMVEKEKDKKIEKLPKGAISSIKSSVISSIKSSVLKENRTLRSKMAITQENAGAGNQKKILAPPPRQQKKLNKRAIEEKRPEIKEVNTHKLRSGGALSTLKKKNPSIKEVTQKANVENEREIHALKEPNNTKNQIIPNKKVLPKAGKSLNKQVGASTHTSKADKKGPESYAITPSRSSFVSYDISEIHTDSEDEEQTSKNAKAVPSWATGVRLRNRLLQLYHEPIDTDELFGNYFEPPDLVAIMGVTKRAYNKRTSSAVWNSSFV